MSSVKFSHYNHVLESICALVLFSDPFSTYRWIQHESWGEKKDGKICLFLFQPLPSRVRPKKGCLCLPQVTAPVKSSSQTACCPHIITSPFILSLSPPHPQSWGWLQSHHSVQDYCSILSIFLVPWPHLCKQFLFKTVLKLHNSNMLFHSKPWLINHFNTYH